METMRSVYAISFHGSCCVLCLLELTEKEYTCHRWESVKPDSQQSCGQNTETAENIEREEE